MQAVRGLQRGSPLGVTPAPGATDDGADLQRAAPRTVAAAGPAAAVLLSGTLACQGAGQAVAGQAAPA